MAPGPGTEKDVGLLTMSAGAAALRRLRLVLLQALVAACMPVLAADENAAAQRARIARERAAVERQAQAAQAACAERFAVTACVDRVMADRRERLRQLDRERALLDDELRKRRAAERTAQIEQRQVELAAGTAVRAGADAIARCGIGAQGRRRRPQRPRATANEAAASQSEADAAERAAASARRAAQAEAHRSAVEKRNRERAAQHAPSPPLPQAPQAPASR